MKTHGKRIVRDDDFGLLCERRRNGAAPRPPLRRGLGRLLHAAVRLLHRHDSVVVHGRGRRLFRERHV